jgi:hypothetical protein
MTPKSAMREHCERASFGGWLCLGRPQAGSGPVAHLGQNEPTAGESLSGSTASMGFWQGRMGPALAPSALGGDDGVSQILAKTNPTIENDVLSMACMETRAPRRSPRGASEVLRYG